MIPYLTQRIRKNRLNHPVIFFLQLPLVFEVIMTGGYNKVVSHFKRSIVSMHGDSGVARGEVEMKKKHHEC